MKLVFVATVTLAAVASRSAFACRGCEEPTLTELARAAALVVAGKVDSADKHEHSVIAVSSVWKGSAQKTLARTGCWQLFEKAGAKVIVLAFPDDFRSKWV